MPDSLAVRLAKLSPPEPPRSTSSPLARVSQVLDTFASRDHTGEVLTAVRHFPAREAQWADFPEWVNADLRAAYNAKGIRQLYTHQAAAAEAVHAGKNVVIVTPTASGKTLCYNLPVLNAILENPDTRALYLFPTKALAQDQLAELHDLNQRLDNRFGVFTYDGDTPSDARKAIREKSHIVLTNPDMLHTGILPHHTKWTRLFENLALHRARRAAHLSRRLRQPPRNVLRRLRRIARFYGREPQFICCSATIANPGELAVAPDRKRSRSARRKRRARRGKNFRLLQSAGGEPRPGHPPQLHQRILARRAGIPEARSADHGLRQSPPAHRSAAHLSAASQSRSCPGKPETDSRLSRRLSARRAPRNRARPARRPHSRRGRHQRARTGHRRRLARRRR